MDPLLLTISTSFHILLSEEQRSGGLKVVII